MLEALGRALQAGRTPASDVREIFRPGRAACERTGRQDQLVGMLRGESLYHLIRGQYPSRASGPPKWSRSETTPSVRNAWPRVT